MCLNAAGQKDGINLPLLTKKSPISELANELATNELVCQCQQVGEPGSAVSGGKFRQQEHLKRRVELTRVFKKGRAVYSPGAKLFFLANDLPHNRIVITFARKYGNAVQRNRARRLGREAYRLMRDNLKTGYDLVLLLYPHPKEIDPANAVPKTSKAGSLAESSEQLQTLFKKAHLMVTAK